MAKFALPRSQRRQLAIAAAAVLVAGAVLTYACPSFDAFILARGAGQLTRLAPQSPESSAVSPLAVVEAPSGHASSVASGLGVTAGLLVITALVARSRQRSTQLPSAVARFAYAVDEKKAASDRARAEMQAAIRAANKKRVAEKEMALRGGAAPAPAQTAADLVTAASRVLGGMPSYTPPASRSPSPSREMTAAEKAAAERRAAGEKARLELQAQIRAANKKKVEEKEMAKRGLSPGAVSTVSTPSYTPPASRSPSPSREMTAAEKAAAERRAVGESARAAMQAAIRAASKKRAEEKEMARRF